MKGKPPVVLLLFLFLAIYLPSFLNAQSTGGIFILETFLEDGTPVNKGPCVLLKNHFVLANYWLVAGCRKMKVSVPGGSQSWESDGYLNVAEDKDLVILSVPGLTGEAVKLSNAGDPPPGTAVNVVQLGTGNSISLRRAVVKGMKEISGLNFVEALSSETDDCISGPVYAGEELAGFVSSGYFDRKYHLYMVPIRHVFPILSSSFIIKTFDSFNDEKPVRRSRYQAQVQASIDNVIWISFEDAVRLAKKNRKKILIDVYTPWCGWCNMMDNQVYNQRNIISYLNENFYAVKLDAEGRDTIWHQGKEFSFSKMLRAHELAYSLLGGKMTYPGTVFLDSDINLLTVVPGFMDVKKMNIVLHFFKEEAYRKPGMTFENYQSQFVERED